MIGQKLLHYEIVEKLGEGGMGVVYKARDTHLDRFVAVKVLPPEKVADAGRKARFVQEAKSASALNHPNIVTVHDISSEGGVDFIAMEFVAGKTLDQLIPRKGMRLNDALKIAVQIADALARAHAAGIVHRDLKPSNIMVTGDGHVKVLDFGLAKLTETALGEDEATRTAKPRTEEGTVVGTAAYMSPEQAEGKPVDARSDIFSFGAVLYEMVTGQRAFRGGSRISTLSAVLHQDPAPFPTEAPKELQRVTARCLKKDPDRRFHHMIDVKVALTELREESESGQLETPPHQARRRRGVWVWTAPALLVLCLGGAGWYWFSAGKTPPAEAAYRAVPFTNDPGVETDPAFSPDGNQVAFSWDGEKQDNFDIYLRLVGAGMGRLRITTDPAPDYSPAFSPDGRTIAFLRDVSANRAAVCLVSALGGTERRLVEIENLPAFRAARIVGRYLTWTPDGKWLVVSYPAAPGVKRSFGLFLLSIDSGAMRPLTSPQIGDPADHDPAFSPDGKSLGFIRGPLNARDVYVLPLTGDYRPARDAKRITFDSRWVNGIAWTPDGQEIIYSSGWMVDQALWRVSASGSGPPRRVNWVGERGYLPAISRRGGRLAYQSYYENKDLWRLDLAAPGVAAGKPVKLIASTQSEEVPAYSPDGRRIAFCSMGSGSYEIWVADADGGNPRAVTAFGRGSTVGPSWSPDGKRIAFGSNVEGGQGEIFVVGAEGGAPLRITTHPAGDWYPSYSRDGRWIYFTSTRTGESQIWKTPSVGGEPVQVTRTGGAFAFESADGKFLYYSRSRLPSSFSGIWRVAAGGGEPEEVVPEAAGILRFRVVEEGIYLLSWLSMDRSIPLRFFRFADGKIRTVAELGRQSYPSFCVSPDGRNIVHTSSGAIENDIVLVENFR